MYQILSSSGCGLRYLSPQPSADELVLMYSEDYFQSATPERAGYAQYIDDASQLRAMFRAT
jgi:hypothetical protein